MDDLEVEYSGKFFVWTKKGHAPRHAWDSRELATAEAARLAKENPGRKFIVQQFLDKVSVPQTRGPIVDSRKEPAMNKTIWAGAKDNNVAFARNQNSLTSQGYNNPTSFTVSGDVNGLHLIDEEQTQTQSQAQAQPQS